MSEQASVRKRRRMMQAIGIAASAYLVRGKIISGTLLISMTASTEYTSRSWENGMWRKPGRHVEAVRSVFGSHMIDMVRVTAWVFGRRVGGYSYRAPTGCFFVRRPQVLSISPESPSRAMLIPRNPKSVILVNMGFYHQIKCIYI